MVKRMKKYSFLIYHNDYDIFLQDLRKLGLMHIAKHDETEIEQDDELESYLQNLKKLEEARKELVKIEREEKIESIYREANIELGYQIPHKMDTINDSIANVQQELQVSLKEKEQLESWGDFDPENIEKLRRAGYYINFFSIQKSHYNKEWEELYNAIVIDDKTSRVHFITITRENNVEEELNIEPTKLADVSLSKLSMLIESIKQKKKNEEDKLRELVADIPSIDAAIKDLESKVSLKGVELKTSKVADNKLMLMQGWAPADKEGDITSYLQSKDAYFRVSAPSPEDDVPIVFENNRFFRLFEAISRLYMLPKYNEIDLTPFFAPFFMIFFGLSLGDIGYGLFLFVVATVVKLIKKSSLGDTMRSSLSLIQVLGVAAIFSGMLTGGFFGVNLYDLNNPVSQQFKEKVFFNNDMMFNLALILGGIQVIFGMMIKVFNRAKQFGFIYGVSTIGWIVFLLSFIVSLLVPHALPMFGTLHLIILAISGVAIFFLNSPGKNIFLNMGLGLWDTYNMATGLLGDILSYVRLFALGLSGGILASVFTDLAVGMSPDNIILGPIVTILIFVIGHAINIFMNTLGAIVHPLRLTFVEFFKNAEFTGGGQKYQPFT